MVRFLLGGARQPVRAVRDDSGATLALGHTECQTGRAPKFVTAAMDECNRAESKMYCDAVRLPEVASPEPGGRLASGLTFALNFAHLAAKLERRCHGTHAADSVEIYDFVTVPSSRRTATRRASRRSAPTSGCRSVATVHKHVQHLVGKGYVRKSWNRSRSVEPVEQAAGGASAVPLPLLGTVAAGLPIEAIEVQETIEVPAHLVPRSGECFVLKVRGDSMIDEQIRDGDFVVVEQRPEARDGETVVALVRGEDATLKKLYRRGRMVRLQPANPTMDPIDVRAEEVEVRGIVRGLLRSY